MTAPSPTCRAPHVGWRFSPDGSVHACCVNDRVPYGVVGDGRSLRQIWSAPERARLRDSLDVGDFSLGCQDCGAEHALGQRLQTHAEAYDRYPQPTEPLQWPKRVEFALSNTCNLQCVHCNGDLSSAIRARRERRPPLASPYGDEFFEELRELLPHVEVAVFIGGEPFLARECRRVWDLLIEMDLHPEVHVTTNATVWDDRVEHYLHALRMSVAVSIDGATSDVNDAIRVGSDFAEVTANRDRFLAATRGYGSAFCVNHCFMRQNWHELGDVLVEAERHDVPAHVIPVLYPPQMSVFHLPPSELAGVRTSLGERSAQVRPLLGRNRSAWDATLAHLDAVLADEPRESSVVVRAVVDRSVLDAERRVLRRWAGQDPVVITLDGARIAQVDEPAWAAPFDVSSFVGRRLGELEAAMLELLGDRRDEQVEREASGTIRTTYHAIVAGVEVPFRTTVVPPGHVISVTPMPLDSLVAADEVRRGDARAAQRGS